MRDIVVTTPKSEISTAAKEAADCIRNGGGYYFRRLPSMPHQFGAGSKVFYVEDGYVRGYGLVCEAGGSTEGWVCQTTTHYWPPGNYAVMPAQSWTWIKPIPMRGFQRWRYFSRPAEEVGGWLDPKPEVS